LFAVFKNVDRSEKIMVDKGKRRAFAVRRFKGSGLNVEASKDAWVRRAVDYPVAIWQREDGVSISKVSFDDRCTEAFEWPAV
jgi:hypothetical protein